MPAIVHASARTENGGGSLRFNRRFRMPLPRGTFPLPAGFPRMRQDPYDWPRVGGFVVVWLVIAVVAGMALLALFDPGSIQVLVTAEL